MSDVGHYRVLLDKKWTLADLSAFPHAYLQTYAFAYCFQSDLPPRDANRINEVLKNYPWQGGYSYVNAYFVLQGQVPPKYRPQISSIQYASPGWIDLLLNLDPAVCVASSVAAIAGSAAAIGKAYSSLQKSLHEISERRKKSDIVKLRLSREEAKELRLLSEELAELMEFKKLDELVERAGNIEVASKLIAAQYRRLKALTKYVEKGQLKLPTSLRDENDQPVLLP